MKLKLILVFCTALWAYSVNANESGNEVSFYSGTFDIVDKEGDDQTNLFGMEHKNPNLFRDTFLGKFSVAIVMLTIALELITYSKFTTIAMLLTSGKNFNILIFIEIITLVIVLLSLANKVYYMTRLNQEK